jgi:phosphoglycerate dehydrogenase-like enzyme
MMTRILIAVDDFTSAQMERVRDAVRSWARVHQIPQGTGPQMYQKELEDADVVIGWPPPELLAGSGIQLVQTGSSGWDGYEDQGLKESGIALCTGRGIYSVGVAEHCIAMMLALTRRLPIHFRDQQQKIFCRRPPYAEITGATACIVGLGSIGLGVSSRCLGLGMRVIGVTRDGTSRSSIDEIFPVQELKTAVGCADHIFMTAAGSRANRNLISREVLEAFPVASYFYNVSRGWTVDEAALCEMLQEGRIAGAGLDVTLTEPLPPESPFWTLGDNVLVTGHSAGISEGYTERFCRLVIENLNRFHKGEPLQNRVL